MLFIFAVVYLLQDKQTQALAMPVGQFVTQPQKLPVSSLNGQRSIWDIIWSCLATIFACSWVSVHPNIPPPGAGAMKVAIRRVELMAWSIIAPEYTIFWAAVQWISARKIQKKYADRGWTKTHGFFIQMGGFMLYEDNIRKGVLSLEALEDLLENEKITFPTITDEEINDRSKADGLAKALVLTQTSWFVVQVLVRHIRRLVITELELATVAFGVLNGAMYFLWWNKPLDIRCGVPIHVVNSLEDNGVDIASTTSEISHATCSSEGNSILEQSPEFPSLQFPLLPHTHIRPPPINSQTVLQPQSSPLHLIARLKVLWKPIKAILTLLIHRIKSATIPPREGQMSVAIFYAGKTSPKERGGAVLFSIILGMIFGGIHCTGWNLSFPTSTERDVWRSCAAIITAMLPAGLAFNLMLLSIASLLRINPAEKGTPFIRAGEISLALGIAIYVSARIGLLIVAFSSLRNLPAGAYDVVPWTTFIPHV